MLRLDIRLEHLLTVGSKQRKYENMDAQTTIFTREDAHAALEAVLQTMEVPSDHDDAEEKRKPLLTADWVHSERLCENPNHPHGC